MRGLMLVGNRVRFRHLQPGTGTICTRLHDNGMVEIEELPGLFAPHLFVLDAELPAATEKAE